MAINKVVYGSNTLIDLTSTTAVASDVAQGKQFFLADGSMASGTHSLDLDALTVTPSEGTQVFKPYGDEINYTIPTASSLSSNPMVGTVDLSFLTYGKQYKVTGKFLALSNLHASSGDTIEFDTLWTASEDGEIAFSRTASGTSAHPNKITLSKTQIKVFYPDGVTVYGGQFAYGNADNHYLIFSEKNCDGYSQVTVNAIPSQYIIPTGTKTITANGTGIDVASYASIDVNVSGGGTGGNVWQDAQGYVHLDDEGTTPITVEPLSVTQNGTYTAPTGTAYSPVTVNVSGGGGLEYETGTWSPSEDVARPTISFTNSHTTPPIHISFVDATNDYGTSGVTNANMGFEYTDWWRLTKAGLYYASSTIYYGVANYWYRTTNAESFTTNRAYFTANSDNAGDSGTTYPRYWANETGFRPYTSSSSRHWLAGRTYKWIAVWAPTT